MTRSGNKPDIEFVYDAAGNRVSKKIRTKNSGGTYTPASDNTNYYIRDASGNIMAVYEEVSGVQTLAELPIYGSDRVGALTPGLNLSAVNRFNRIAGRKSYELKDHLGNVRVVINDFKIGRDNTGDSKSDYYLAKISSFSDYGPFGELLEARTSNASRYRYGFNGKEKDGEWNSGGAIYDYGFRIYDPRIAKFLSVDPLTDKYPYYTPYQFAGNKPIFCVDVDGLEDAPGIERFSDMMQGKTAGMTTEETVEFNQETDQARATGAKGGLITGGVIFGGGVGLTYFRNNWVEIIHNPIIPLEIGALIYSLAGGEDMPFPAAPAASAASKVGEIVEADSKLLIAMTKNRSHVLVGIQKEEEAAKWLHQTVKRSESYEASGKVIKGPGLITGPRDTPTPNSHDIFEIPINNVQADAGQSLMQQMRGPNTYNIFNKSCVICAKNVMDAATDKKTSIFTMTPQQLEQYVQKAYAPKKQQ